MLASIYEAWEIITGYSATELIFLFWPLFFLELPRYTITVVAASIFYRKPMRTDGLTPPPYSIVMVGHNEARNLERSILSLREQSHPPAEILVFSDGSNDDMRKEISKLKKNGLIQSGHHVNFRGGKAAGMNLIKEFAKHDVIIAVDCDTSFHRQAMKAMALRMKDPKIGAICGQVQTRHPYNSLLTTMQHIEYVYSIALGKYTADLMGQVSCLSGAFTAFRKSAIQSVGGMDAGSGEDLDLTLRLRQAGWETRYCKDAICYTEVPDTMERLIRQRLRWERDGFGLRYFKYSDTINPLNQKFSAKEIFHNLDFFLFNFFGAVIMLFYIPWIFYFYGGSAPSVLIAAWMLLIVQDVILLSAGLLMKPRIPLVWCLPYLPLFSLYMGLFMRGVRLLAYFQEIYFRSSKKDDFVPAQVRREIMDML